MKLFTKLCLSLFVSVTSLTAGEIDSIVASAKLVFEDDFERNEANESKEAIGNGWTSNSARRAKGNKQADLVDGYLKVSTHPVADHAAVIFHDAGFKDGAVTMKFKLGVKDSLNLDFVDREDKSTWAGHLFNTVISTSKVNFRDGKYGVFDMSIRERKLAKKLTKEDQVKLKASSKNVAHQITADQWHELFVLVKGDVMSVYINQNKVGEFKTAAVAHPIKRWISITAPKTICIDDLKIYQLDE